MSGWLAFLALALATLAIVRVVARIDRGATMLLCSALFVAAAGYAWQGMPGLAGAPHAATRTTPSQSGLFEDERLRLTRVYGESAQWLTLADGLARAGDDRAAALLLETQSRRRPRDVALATGYAHALLVLADYHYTPAVALAFDRAMAIDPADPAPRYFAAFAKLEGRDVTGAQADWQALARTLPPASQWRAVIADRLQMLAIVEAQVQGMPQP